MRLYRRSMARLDIAQCSLRRPLDPEWVPRLYLAIATQTVSGPLSACGPQVSWRAGPRATISPRPYVGQ
jgi:hypothetical protein